MSYQLQLVGLQSIARNLALALRTKFNIFLALLHLSVRLQGAGLDPFAIFFGSFLHRLFHADTTDAVDTSGLENEIGYTRSGACVVLQNSAESRRRKKAAEESVVMIWWVRCCDAEEERLNCFFMIFRDWALFTDSGEEDLRGEHLRPLTPF